MLDEKTPYKDKNLNDNDDDDNDRLAGSPSTNNKVSPSRKGVGRAAAQRADAEKLAAREAKENAALSAARERARKANVQQSKAQRVQAIVAEKELQIDISRKRRQRNAIADSAKHDDPTQAESLREGIKEAARNEAGAAVKRKEAAAGILDEVLLEELLDDIVLLDVLLDDVVLLDVVLEVVKLVELLLLLDEVEVVFVITEVDVLLVEEVTVVFDVVEVVR